MKGLTLLLKSLGIEIDPEDLKRKAAEVVATIQHFDTQVTLMNERLGKIEEKLELASHGVDTSLITQ